MTIQIKTTKQYFPIMLYRENLTFESVDEILLWGHSKEALPMIVTGMAHTKNRRADGPQRHQIPCCWELQPHIISNEPSSGVGRVGLEEGL